MAAATEYKTLPRRIVRHARALHHLTGGRLWNAVRLLRDLRARVEEVRSCPVLARINVCSLCNLACPGCAIHDDKHGIKPYVRPKATMQLATFEAIIDALRDSLLAVILYDEGEPLLNRSLWEMVGYAARSRVRTTVSTNLSLRMADADVEALVGSGLDHLIVALDGYTQPTYEQHRQGGDVERVKGNLERIMAAKRRRARCGLKVEVQFLEFAHNLHEKQAVIDFARRCGVDVINSFLPYSAELEDVGSLRGRPRRHYGCLDVYATADFDVDGSLYACDFQEDGGRERIGSIHDAPFAELWNGARMQALRRGFRRGAPGPLDPSCAECPVTRGLPWLLR